MCTGHLNYALTGAAGAAVRGRSARQQALLSKRACSSSVSSCARAPAVHGPAAGSCWEDYARHCTAWVHDQASTRAVAALKAAARPEATAANHQLHASLFKLVPANRQRLQPRPMERNRSGVQLQQQICFLLSVN